MIQTRRSLTWLDYYLFALLDPRRLAEAVVRAEPRPLPLGAAVMAAVAIGEIIALSFLSAQTEFFFVKLTYGWIFTFLVMALKVAVLSALFDFSCQIMGCEGRGVPILNVVMFSLSPRLFLLPLVMVFTVFGFAPGFFYVFFSLGFAVWSSLIIIQAISELHRIKFSRALMIFMMPIVAVGLALFFAMVLIGMLMVALVNG